MSFSLILEWSQHRGSKSFDMASTSQGLGFGAWQLGCFQATDIHFQESFFVKCDFRHQLKGIYVVTIGKARGRAQMKLESVVRGSLDTSNNMFFFGHKLHVWYVNHHTMFTSIAIPIACNEASQMRRQMQESMQKIILLIWKIKRIQSRSFGRLQADDTLRPVFERSLLEMTGWMSFIANSSNMFLTSQTRQHNWKQWHKHAKRTLRMLLWVWHLLLQLCSRSFALCERGQQKTERPARQFWRQQDARRMLSKLPVVVPSQPWSPVYVVYVLSREMNYFCNFMSSKNLSYWPLVQNPVETGDCLKKDMEKNGSRFCPAKVTYILASPEEEASEFPASNQLHPSESVGGSARWFLLICTVYDICYFHLFSFVCHFLPSGVKFASCFP